MSPTALLALSTDLPFLAPEASGYTPGGLTRPGGDR